MPAWGIFGEFLSLCWAARALRCASAAHCRRSTMRCRLHRVLLIAPIPRERILPRKSNRFAPARRAGQWKRLGYIGESAYRRERRAYWLRKGPEKAEAKPPRHCKPTINVTRGYRCSMLCYKSAIAKIMYREFLESGREKHYRNNVSVRI